ncbi:MAG: N-acetyltransferase family protein [Dehalococcoidia bacterium]
MPRTAKAESAVASRYPKTITAGGKELELRLMGRGDVKTMVTFARAMPPDDLLFLRRNITEADAVDGWVDNIEANQAVVILAFEGGTLAGYSSMNLNFTNWMRHIGEIRLLTGTAYRGIGLGRILADEAYAVSRLLGLRKLSAQMTLDQAGARATFGRLGFRPEALLTDWVMDAKGRTRDLLVMAYDLQGLTDTVDA